MQVDESTIYAILEEIVRLGRNMLKNKTAPVGPDINFIKNLHDYAKLLGQADRIEDSIRAHKDSLKLLAWLEAGGDLDQ